MQLAFDPESMFGDFVADGVTGSAVAETTERVRHHECDFVETRKCKKVRVSFANDRAWREITVRGTLSLRRAIKAALPLASPPPQIRRIGSQDIFGEQVEINL